MSEELSRVRSRQKQYKGEGKSPVKGKKGNPARAAGTEQTETQAAVPGALSRKSRQPVRADSMKSKHAAVQQQEGEATPSRAESYPSERIRFSKMFVNSLIVIFVLLLACLLWWGIEGAPELRTIWK